MSTIILWLVTSGFVPGIITGFLLVRGWWAVMWVWLLAATVAIVGVWYRARVVGLCASIVLLAFGVGIACVNVSPFPYSPTLEALVGRKVVLHGTVVAEPDNREQMSLITLLPDHQVLPEKTVIPVEEPVRILVSISNPHEVTYGDRVEFVGVLKRPAPFETHDTQQFAYPDFLAIRGIGYTSSFATVRVREAQTEWSGVLGTLYGIKRWYLHGIALALPEPHAALAGGITVGDKRSLGESLTNLFQITGMTHIVVLSGYNITVIASSLMWLLSHVVPMVIASWCGMVSIGLFVAMSGASGAAVRAGIMASIVLIARMVRRPYAAPRALAIASVGMLVYEPRLLLFDPGFQLSIVATVGLIFISPLIKSAASSVPERLGLRDIFADSVGTQVAVTPLLMYQMGTLSLVSLPVNLLVLPTVPFAMAASMASAVGGALMPSIAVFVGAPAYVALSYILTVVEWMGAIPYASIAVSFGSLLLLVVLYAVLILCVMYLHERERARAAEPMAVLLRNVARRRSN